MPVHRDPLIARVICLGPLHLPQEPYHCLHIVPFYESEKEEDTGYLKK